VNECKPLRAGTFGDTNDLYYHAPSNRIGANYSPGANGVLEPKPAAAKAGGVLRTSTRPMLNPSLLLLPASVRAFT
jgi:hypothetical protein